MVNSILLLTLFPTQNQIYPTNNFYKSTTNYYYHVFYKLKFLYYNIWPTKNTFDILQPLLQHIITYTYYCNQQLHTKLFFTYILQT